MRCVARLMAVVLLGALGTVGIAAAKEDAVLSAGVKQVGEFAVDWFPRAGVGEGENVATSPYLISSAFALLREGSAGETRKQMDGVFHFPKDYAFPLVKEQDGSGITQSMHSMLFLDRHVELAPAFVKTAKEKFAASITGVDLRDARGAADLISRAVAKATRNLITDAVRPEDLGGTNAFVLAQTLYFKGKWQTKFDPKLTRPGDFKLPGRPGKPVAMMALRENFEYGHFDGMQAVKLPYTGGKYSLLILLPDEGKGFGGEGKRPDVGHVKKMLGQMGTEWVELYLPRFTIEQRRDLKKPLVELGMRDAFGVKADFSGMKATSPGIYLAWAREQVVFAVDEEGTEAASAVTAGGSLFGDTGNREPPKPVVVRVDHPCVMVLLEEASGMPLFVVGLTSPPEWRGK